MHVGILSALMAALLFGLSTPLAKLLLGQVDSWLLAGLLYLGSGCGLSLVRLLRARRSIPLARAEWGWLGGAILCGGVLAPVLLMWGLSRTGGGSASLLLNAEAVFTALLAWLAFKENCNRRVLVGMIAIIVGAVLLSWPADGAALGGSWGALAILAACLCWALDNNLTRKVALTDPLRIAAYKGLVAGGVNGGLAVLMGHASLPSPSVMGLATLVGFLGYGVSLTLFVVALRHLGAARAGAYFSAAPFVGALAAIPLLGEAASPRLFGASLLMGWGVWLHLSERHEHAHLHHVIEHEHPHRHSDQHHDHCHDAAVESDKGSDDEHSHRHGHAQMSHSHPHYPDAHHSHRH